MGVPLMGGGMNQHLDQGIEAQKIWNLGIEAQQIWNLGTEKISGIWNLGVLGNYFLTEYFFSAII